MTRALWRATALAGVLQAAMVLLGLAVPSLRQDNLYPIGGTLLAVLAGWLVARGARAAARAAAVWGGAAAGGISSLLGSMLAALTGQLPAPVSTALVAAVTGALAGGAGGGFGRLLQGKRPPG